MALTCAALAACGTPADDNTSITGAQSAAIDAPLVLLISVDQMRAEEPAAALEGSVLPGF